MRYPLTSTLKSKQALLTVPCAVMAISVSTLVAWRIFDSTRVFVHFPIHWQILMVSAFSAIVSTVLYKIINRRRVYTHTLLLRHLSEKLQQAGLIAASSEVTEVESTRLLSAFDALLEQYGLATQRSRLSEERLRLIADNIPALVAYIDADRHVVLANRGYDKAYSVSVHQLTGQHVSRLLGDDVYAQSAPFMQQVLGGTSTDFERLVTHTGALRWERVSYVPEFRADGAVAGFISLAEDITELKRAQHTFAKSEMRLRMITDNIPALIAYIDSDEHYIFCNGRYETELGLTPDKILGQTVRQVAGEAGYREISGFVAQVLNGERVSFELVQQRHGQRIFQTDFIPDVDMQERVVGFYSMVLDITERKQAQHRQQTSERLLRSVTDNLPALISYIDTDERFQFNNLPYESWFGRPLAEITGQRVADLLSDDDYARHQPAFIRALAGEKAEFEFTAERDGVSRVFQVSYLPQSDAINARTGVCVMINDITALKQVENQLRILARFDTLTGLPNRNQFDEKLAEAIARSKRTGQPMALMFLDIDHFKTINDTLGHHAGDDVLREFALRLTSSVRQTDTVARLAGDEFVIVLEGLNLAQQSTTVAQKIIDAMLVEFDILGTCRNVSTSIGIAITHMDELDGEALLRRADGALYEAKAAGRNTYCLSQ
jgi:diguanylate cyclase (GGDEF)-like protein/PAS domain S-box-containing protein